MSRKRCSFARAAAACLPRRSPRSLRSVGAADDVALVFVVAPHPAQGGVIAAAGRLLPVLLAPERGEIEPVVGAVEQVDAALEAGVGVEDAVLAAQERADAHLLA